MGVSKLGTLFSGDPGLQGLYYIASILDPPVLWNPPICGRVSSWGNSMSVYLVVAGNIHHGSDELQST